MQDTFLHEVMPLTAAFDLKEKDKEESFVPQINNGHLHSVRRQPEGVQVVEVGLVMFKLDAISAFRNVLHEHIFI